MFPTTPTTANESGREAIKRDFYDIDSLIGELATPKEQINRGPNSTGSPGAGTSNNNSISGNSAPDLVESEGEKMSPEVAALSGKMIANTIDTAFGTGCCVYAKNTTPEKYQATPPQIRNLENCWAAVAAKYNYKVEDSPVINAAIQTFAIYFPHFQEAKIDRRFAIMEEKAREETAAREALAKRVEELEKLKPST